MNTTPPPPSPRGKSFVCALLPFDSTVVQKKNEALHSSNANIHEAANNENNTNIPKQTVRDSPYTRITDFLSDPSVSKMSCPF